MTVKQLNERQCSNRHEKIVLLHPCSSPVKWGFTEACQVRLSRRQQSLVGYHLHEADVFRK